MGQCCSTEQGVMSAAEQRSFAGASKIMSNNNNKGQQAQQRLLMDPIEPTSSSDTENVHSSHLLWMTSPTGQTTVTTATATPPEQQVDKIIHHHPKDGSSDEDNAEWVPYDDLGSRKTGTTKSASRSSKRNNSPRSSSSKRVMMVAQPVDADDDTPPRPFTPLVQVSESVNDSIIIEERDPEMPSDEELSHPGRGSGARPTIVWRQQQQQQQGLLPKQRPSPNSMLQTVESNKLDPPGKQAVHPDAFGQFQKLKLAAAVASQNELVQTADATDPVLDQVEQDQQHRALYQQFLQQERAQEMQKRQLIAQQEEAGAETKKSPWWKRLRKSSNNKGNNKQQQSSDNAGSQEELLFDFQGQTFDKNVIDIDPLGEFVNDDDDDDASQTSRQSSLSLHSESSMDAQRKLFAQKAREREQKKNDKPLFGQQDDEPADADADAAAEDPPATHHHVVRPDYGPVLQHQQQPRGTPAARGNNNNNNKHRSCNASTTSSTGTPGPVNMHVHVDDEYSLISDLGDEYSVSASSGFWSHQKQSRVNKPRMTPPPTNKAFNDDYGVAASRMRRHHHRHYGSNTTQQQDRHDQIDPRFAQRLQAAGTTTTTTSNNAWHGDEEDLDHAQQPAPPRAGTRMGLVADRLAVFNRLQHEQHQHHTNNKSNTPLAISHRPGSTSATPAAAAPRGAQQQQQQQSTTPQLPQQPASPPKVQRKPMAPSAAIMKEDPPKPPPPTTQLPKKPATTTKSTKPVLAAAAKPSKEADKPKPGVSSKKTTATNPKINKVSSANKNRSSATTTTSKPLRTVSKSNTARTNKPAAATSPAKRPGTSKTGSTSPVVKDVDRVLSHLIHNKPATASSPPSKYGSADQADKPVVLSVTAMSTDEFLQCADQPDVFRSGGGSNKPRLSLAQLRGNGNDLETAHNSLRLAEKVEAQVETVLSNFRADNKSTVGSGARGR